ncbi:MAG: HAD-IA family hydrolase [Fimbriimonadaceae bacterium]
MTRIRAVCFDIGGVLAEVALTWDAALAAAGLPAPTEKQIPLEEFATFKLYQAGQLDIEAYLDELACFLGIEVAAALKVHESILLRPTERTLEIVNELNANGFVTGCLSNTNTLHWGVLTDAGRFPNVAALQIKAASQLIGHNKPAEASYRAFEAMAGVSPSEVLFFEDGPKNVAAARQLGWSAVLIDPLGRHADQILQGLSQATTAAGA